MEIEGILKSCLWILLHQGMFSLLHSKIQGYMLSLMNEVDPSVAYAVGFVWDVKPVFPTIGIKAGFQYHLCIPCWVSFRIQKKNHFLGVLAFCSDCSV